MTLTKEQEALLNGEKGEVMAKIMKTLVMFGDTFGAERLVPVTGKYGHTVISYGLKVLGPVLDVFDERGAGEARCFRPFGGGPHEVPEVLQVHGLGDGVITPNAVGIKNLVCGTYSGAVPHHCQKPVIILGL